MNKAISIIRITALLALAFAGIYGVFCEPLDDSATYGLDFWTSKALGALSLYTEHLLYRRWVRTDHWLAAYDRWINMPDRS